LGESSDGSGGRGPSTSVIASIRRKPRSSNRIESFDNSGAFDIPADSAANPNTAVFDKRGHLLFTGQSGIYGNSNPKNDRMRVFDARRDRAHIGSA
jgi:streptogramin lyase